jgi:hypothetical protein
MDSEYSVLPIFAPASTTRSPVAVSVLAVRFPALICAVLVVSIASGAAIVTAPVAPESEGLKIAPEVEMLVTLMSTSDQRCDYVPAQLRQHDPGAEKRTCQVVGLVPSSLGGATISAGC